MGCGNFVSGLNENIEYALKGSWLYGEPLGLLLVGWIDIESFTDALNWLKS